MPLAAKSGSEALSIDYYIRTGNPVLTNLTRHTTLALAFGKPTKSMTGDAYSSTPMPKVSFEKIENLKMDPGKRYYAFPLFGNIDAGETVTRGSGLLASRTPVSTDAFDALRFQAAYHTINYDIPADRLEELQGEQWAVPGSFSSESANAIMRNYLDEAATAIWATGAGVMPVDGVLGSIFGLVSDGLTTAERGATGPDESAYAAIAGYTRSTSNTGLSSFISVQSGSPALTIEMLEACADVQYSRGATKIVVPMRSARYRKLQKAIRDTFGDNAMKEDEQLLDIGIASGLSFRIGDITCYMDNDIPAGTQVVSLDLPSLVAGSGFSDVSLDMFHNSATKGSKVLHGTFKHQMMSPDPRKHAKVVALESL